MTDYIFIVESTETITFESLCKEFGMYNINKMAFVAYLDLRGGGKYKVIKDKLTSHNYIGQLISGEKLKSIIV